MTIAFHPYVDAQTEWINASMQQYLWVFVNHQQSNWVQWLAMTELAANIGISESTKCSPFCSVQGMDHWISCSGEPTEEQDG
jgi:hypothetical protein